MESKRTSLQMDWGWGLVFFLSLSPESGLHTIHMRAVTLPTSREDRMTCCGQGLAHHKEGATHTVCGGGTSAEASRRKWHVNGGLEEG